MEEQKNENQKKFYEKWWFWVIVAFIIICILGENANTNNTNTSDDITTTNETISENQQEEKITIIDFNNIEVEDIYQWFDKNGINGKVKNEYSDTVKEGKLISQNIPANTEVSKGTEIELIYSLGKEPTLGQKEAYESAQKYIKYDSFSKKELIEQLIFDGFTQEEAEYAVAKIGY